MNSTGIYWPKLISKEEIASKNCGPHSELAANESVIRGQWAYDEIEKKLDIH